MQLEFLDALIDDELRTLCVPLDQCVSVKTGKIDLGPLAKLENRGLDQAPVYSSDRTSLLGLISTRRLRELSESGEQVDGTIQKYETRHIFSALDLFLLSKNSYSP